MSVSAIAKHIDVDNSKIVRARSGAIVAVLLTAGPTQTATLILYDNSTNATGTKLAPVKARSDTSFVWQPSLPYRFENGIFATLTGVGASAIVVYL